MPARDCPFFSRKNISPKSRWCTKVLYHKIFSVIVKIFLCRDGTRKRENRNVPSLLQITGFRFSAVIQCQDHFFLCSLYHVINPLSLSLPRGSVIQCQDHFFLCSLYHVINPLSLSLPRGSPLTSKIVWR